MSPLERFSKWIQLKIYQFEVTYSVYMLTPMEKFFIYSLLFLLTSLTSIAVFLYLPRHVSFIINRAWFYAHGDSQLDSAHALLKSAAARSVDSLSQTFAQTAASAATVVREL